MYYQATAVAFLNRGYVFIGPPGSGKSTIALHLIARGARLIGDDMIVLQHQKRWEILSPPRLQGVLYVRNYGFYTQVPLCPKAFLQAVFYLGDKVPAPIRRLFQGVPVLHRPVLTYTNDPNTACDTYC